MRTLLRSLMWMDPAERVECVANIRVVDKGRLTYLQKAEADLLEEVNQFYLANAEAPSLKLMQEQAEASNAPERAELVEEVAAQTMHLGASFKGHFEKLVEDQASQSLLTVLREAAKIATQGSLLGKIPVKGTDAALSYIMSAAKGVPKSFGAKTPNAMGPATVALKTLYQNRKANPTESYGVMSGYGVIDSSTGGHKKKQLWLHAGYVAHLKSTSMLNMVLNAAVDGGWNPLVFSSEMPQEEMMYLLVAMHSANPRFNTINPPLSASQLMGGRLDAKAEAFYDLVMGDLVNNKDHGKIRMIDTSEFDTFGSIQQRTIREHADMEVDQVWIDYLTRLPVDTKYRTLTLVQARNETIADAKRFAMSFDGGRGLAVCSPFQINRDGFKRARDNGGRMDTTMLAEYNAAEKEADIITGIFFGEEEEQTNEPKLTVMKSRWGRRSPTPTSVFVEPDSRRIFDLSQGMSFVQAGAAEDTVEL